MMLIFLKIIFWVIVCFVGYCIYRWVKAMGKGRSNQTIATYLNTSHLVYGFYWKK